MKKETAHRREDPAVRITKLADDAIEAIAAKCPHLARQGIVELSVVRMVEFIERDGVGVLFGERK